MAVSKHFLYDTSETENNNDDKYQINVFSKHLERSASILMSMDNDDNTKIAIQHSFMVFKKYANLANNEFINNYKNSTNKLYNNLIALCIYFRPSLCDNITNFIRQRLLIFTDDFSSFITAKIILHNICYILSTSNPWPMQKSSATIFHEFIGCRIRFSTCFQDTISYSLYSLHSHNFII